MRVPSMPPVAVDHCMPLPSSSRIAGRASWVCITSVVAIALFGSGVLIASVSSLSAMSASRVPNKPP